MKKLFLFLKRHRELVILCGILGFSILLRLAFLHEPFERDEGQYAAIGQEILRGGIPYRDAIEIKPPGVFYLYALAIKLFGATPEGIRIFTSIYATLTVISVYAFARRIAGVRAGLFAALTYGVFSTLPMYQGSSSNSEVFLVLPLTAGTLFFVMVLESGERKFLCYSGICAALAMIIKTVALPVIVFELLLIAFIRSGKERWKDVLKDGVAFVLPLIISAALTCSYFALRGGFEDFYYWNVLFPSTYKASGITGPRLSVVVKHLMPSLLFPMTVALFSLPWFWSCKRTLSGLFTLLLIPAAWCVVALPGKFFPHYFITMIPFLSIPAGIALAHLSSVRKPVALFFLAVAIILLGFSIKENYRFYTVYPPETVSMKKYGSIFVSAVPVAKYLKEHTVPDDYIFQWGLEPEIYFLADRRSPVPYLTSVSVGWSKDPEKARRALLEALLTKKPKYIVFQNEWGYWPGFQEVKTVIDVYYVHDKFVPFGYIARRKDIPPANQR